MADSLCSGSRESRTTGRRKSLRGNVKSFDRDSSCMHTTYLRHTKRYLPRYCSRTSRPLFLQPSRTTTRYKWKIRKRSCFGKPATAASFSKFKPTCPKKTPLALVRTTVVYLRTCIYFFFHVTNTYVCHPSPIRILNTEKTYIFISMMATRFSCSSRREGLHYTLRRSH